ncbi:nuclease [Brevundimonas sp.]|uniref:thermonuclease family protein n=1 Tax=Brevundimonas sp. TaxID=1871086 RepID=UPI0025807E93|nr:nuclease [Brevundimonas sp.]
MAVSSKAPNRSIPGRPSFLPGNPLHDHDGSGQAGRMKWWLILLALALPTIAHADPCEGRLPDRPGQAFSGLVRYVGDGDGLCVGDRTNPSTWIEVRLADFDAPELNASGGRAARDQLRRLVMGRRLDCVATRGRNGRVVVYDRVIATCRVNGRRVGDLMRVAGVREGGN